jgi:hypothetical protein
MCSSTMGNLDHWYLSADTLPWFVISEYCVADGAVESSRRRQRYLEEGRINRSKLRGEMISAFLRTEGLVDQKSGIGFSDVGNFVVLKYVVRYLGWKR